MVYDCTCTLRRIVVLQKATILRRLPEAALPSNQVLFRLKPKIRVIQRVLLMLSDQQLVTGIATSIAIYASFCTVQVYHFLIASHIALLSSAVHVLSLVALRDELHQHRFDWTNILRIALMLANVGLLAPNLYHLSYDGDTSVPLAGYDAHCLLSSELATEIQPKGHTFFGLGISLLTITFATSAFLVCYSFPESRRKIYLGLRGFSIIMGFIMVCLTVYGVTESLKKPTDPRIVILNGEPWGFGQILAVGLLIVPLLNMIEINEREQVHIEENHINMPQLAPGAAE